jgi:PAS domain S-box-containing protein
MQLATRGDQTEELARPCENDEVVENNNSQKDTRVSENDPPQSRDDLQIVARATNDAVRDWDLRTGRLSWPQGLDSLLGYCRSSACEEIAFWNQNVHPKDLARIVPNIADALAGTAEHWSDEYRFRRADGTYVALLERALIVRDATGRPVRFVGSLMDVTARKQLQDQLCRSQRMEAFGQLAAGLAHDFNNFLTTILGYSDLVLAEANRKSTVAQHIAEIRGAAGRASALTGQLLAFSRKQALEPRVAVGA